jgi:predicted transcriptional regulator of viral defense system
MAEIPPTPMTEYAEAVALVGAGAVIADESALAMLELALVSPARIKVAAPRRTRASLPPTIHVVRRTLRPDDVTQVDGIATMTIAAAMRACRGRVMPSRLQDGVRDAARRQLLDDATAASLLSELSVAGHG